MHDVFYFTDVHGNYDLYKAAIDYCMEQDPESMIIYGGDACDRGNQGYKIMKNLLDNPQVVYLKGNHEDMFVRAAHYIYRDYKGEINKERCRTYLYSCTRFDFRASEVQLSISNGGFWTLMDWMQDGMPMDFVNKIAKLPLTFSYENIDFCHAGGQYEVFTRAAHDEYDEEFVDLDDKDHILWDRNYIGYGWTDNRICVFGHTPTTELPAKYYCQDKSMSNAHPASYTGLLDDRFNGKKIDMDTCTAHSGKLYVLNCLTLKAQGFRDKDLGQDEINKHEIEKIEVIQL